MRKQPQYTEKIYGTSHYNGKEKGPPPNATQDITLLIKSRKDGLFSLK